MLKTMKKVLVLGAASLLEAAALAGCGDSDRTADGKVNLSFQIWDDSQRKGMESVARVYMDRNPEVNIEVQVTSWDEYWTKHGHS